MKKCVSMLMSAILLMMLSSCGQAKIKMKNSMDIHPENNSGSIIESGDQDTAQSFESYFGSGKVNMPLSVMEEKLGGESISGIIWLDEEIIIISSGGYRRSQFWSLNIDTGNLEKIYDEENDTSYIFSNIEKTKNGFNISEYGGNIYVKSGDNPLHKVDRIDDVLEVQMFSDAKTGEFYYYNQKTSELIGPKGKIYLHDPDMGAPIQMSISPDGTKIGFSCSDGHININKSFTIDLKTLEVNVVELNLFAPFFLWIDNNPAFIDANGDNGEAIIYYGENLKEIQVVNTKGNFHFESGVYSLGEQNNVVLFQSMGGLDNGIYRLRLESFEVQKVHRSNNEIYGSMALSPSSKKVAFTTSTVNPLGAGNLYII